MGFNRSISISVRKYVEGQFKELEPQPIDEFNFVAREQENNLPLEISASVEKSMTSNLNTASITINNALVLETIYQQTRVFAEDFFKFNYSLSIGVGYDDNNFKLLFTGDVDDFVIPESTAGTDKQISLKASTGRLAKERAEIQQSFVAGTTYLEIVESCFAVLLDEYNVELSKIADPDGKLEKPIKHSETHDTLVSNVLDDICRTLDMTWGIDTRRTADDVQRGFIVDKKASFDVHGIHGVGAHAISFQSGLYSVPGINLKKNIFNYTMQPQQKIDIGVLVEVGIRDQMNVASPLPGRVNAISANLNNKSGAFTYGVECQFSDGEFAILPNYRNIAGSEKIS